jgi:hypothetical protein
MEVQLLEDDFAEDECEVIGAVESVGVAQRRESGAANGWWPDQHA